MTNERTQVGEWTLHPDRLSLRHAEQERVIGAQNMALLQFLAARPNELVSREQLLQEVWRGVIVNDNTLSKAIAELRKALGDESKQARYIQTVPRRGYRLIAPVHRSEQPVSAAIASLSGGAVSATATIGNRSRWLLLSLSAALLLLVLIVGSLALWFRDQAAPSARERFSQLRPFTSEPGLELQPAFSPDNRWVAYVAYPLASSTGEIRLRAMNGERQITLPIAAGAPETPSWSPDGQYLAYLLRSGNGCEVHVVRLAEASLEPIDDHVVSTCYNSSIGLGSLQWSRDGNALLFRKLRDGSAPLVQQDWRRGTEQVLGDIYPYVFAMHPNRPQLAYADVAPMSTTLHVLDLATGEKTARLTRPEVFFGMAWDPQSSGILTTRSLVGGQLEYLHEDGRRELLLPSSDALIDPAFSRDGKLLAVVQTRMTYDLWQVELSANGAVDGAVDNRSAAMTLASAPQRPGKPLIQSNRFDYSPRYSHSGQRLAFFSTRSGGPAVWLANADGSDQRQAFVLPVDGAKDQRANSDASNDDTSNTGFAPMPTHLRWSPDDRYLLIGATDLATYLYDFVSGQLRRLNPPDSQTLNPTWSHDGRHIYVSRQQDNDWWIWQLDLQNEHWQPVAELRGAMAEASADGKSLYVLSHGGREHGGLWLYDRQSGQTERVLPELMRRNWQNFSVTASGFHYLHEQDGVLTVYAWSRQHGARVVLPLMPAQEAGPLFVDFTVAPDQRRLVYTMLADFESDIMLLQ